MDNLWYNEFIYDLYRMNCELYQLDTFKQTNKPNFFLTEVCTF